MTILLIAATYVFTPIVVPGSSIQVAFGLNDSEQTMITTADGVSGVYRRGTFTPLPPSDAGLATGFGINNDGVITGTITLADGSDQGFILSGSTYTTFSRPGFIYTAPRAIDNAGMVTGFSFNAVPTVGSRGFLYDPATGTFTDVTPSGSTFTLVQGSNVAGQVTGNSQGRGVTRYGFVWQGGSFTTFRVGDLRTNVRGINDAGLMTGFNLTLSANAAGFIGTPSTGFDRIAAPDADEFGTSCEGINNLRQVVCVYVDTAGVGRAFIASLPEVALARLLDDVTGVGPGKSLEAKVMDAQTDYAGGDIASTCADLTDLLKEVKAQTGKKVSVAAAGFMSTNTTAIQGAIGCR